MWNLEPLGHLPRFMGEVDCADHERSALWSSFDTGTGYLCLSYGTKVTDLDGSVRVVTCIIVCRPDMNATSPAEVPVALELYWGRNTGGGSSHSSDLVVLRERCRVVGSRKFATCGHHWDYGPIAGDLGRFSSSLDPESVFSDLAHLRRPVCWSYFRVGNLPCF